MSVGTHYIIHYIYTLYIHYIYTIRSRYAKRLNDVQTRRGVLIGSAVVTGAPHAHFPPSPLIFSYKSEKCLCGTGIAIILAGQLERPTAMPNLFPPHSNTFRYEAAQHELFSFEKYPVPSHFIWGIKPAETSTTGQRGLGTCSV